MNVLPGQSNTGSRRERRNQKISKSSVLLRLYDFIKVGGPLCNDLHLFYPDFKEMDTPLTILLLPFSY